MRIILAAAIMIGLCSPAISQSEIEKDARVIKLPGCTGFLVEENYLFTAKHCSKEIGKSIDLGTTKLELIYETDEQDGPAIYYFPSVKGETRKSFKLASEAEYTGKTVHTIGYPGGNYAVIYGKMEVGDGRTFNRAAMRIQPGHSGGPLINDKDEVVGIALGVDVEINSNHSYFSGWGLIRKALNVAKTGDSRPSNKGEIVIFTQSDENCPPCKDFHAEMGPELKKLQARGIKITEVFYGRDGWDNLALKEEFSRTTGVKNPGTPTIWVRGTRQTQSGYTKGTRLSVLGWIFRGFKNIGIMLFGHGPDGVIDDSKVEPLPVLPLAPEVGRREGAPVPILVPEESVDWENVTVVILVSKQEIGYAKGAAAGVVLNAIRGPLARANNEYLDGKAELVLIPERTEPERFAAFTAAAQMDPALFYVVVLVKRQDLGLKGLIASRVEKVIKDKLPEGTPVEVVFERIHAQSYANMTTALRVIEQGLEEPSGSLKDSIVEAVKSQVLDAVTGKIDDLKGTIPSESGIVSKVVENLGPAIAETKNVQKENGEEASLWQKILAGLIATVIGGQATGGIRGYMRDRAMGIVGLKINQEEKVDDGTPS